MAEEILRRAHQHEDASLDDVNALLQSIAFSERQEVVAC
jgi:hypothetical protein